ncbi:MAG: hypothetical protein ABIH37_05435 [archaeon]
MKPPTLQQITEEEGFEFIQEMGDSLDIYGKGDNDRLLYDRKEDKVIARYEMRDED